MLVISLIEKVSDAVAWVYNKLPFNRTVTKVAKKVFYKEGGNFGNMGFRFFELTIIVLGVYLIVVDALDRFVDFIVGFFFRIDEDRYPVFPDLDL